MTERRAPRAFDLPGTPARSDVRSNVRESEPVASDPSLGAPPVAELETTSSFRVASDLASSTPPPRSPRAVALDEVLIEADAFAPDIETALVEEAARPRRRGGVWPALALSCLTGLLGLAVGLWVEGLIAELFVLGAWAGLVGVALALGLVVATLAIVGREVIALLRLGRRDALRERAAAAIAARDEAAARAVALDLATALEGRPETARGRGAVRAAKDAIVEADDRLAHAEEALLGPLDAEARLLVVAAARRVSVVTAVAPRALIDIAFVLIENARLVRAIATVYGLRPGRLGMLRLMRDVVGHLAVTGAVSAGDAVIEQAVGHGVASRVSARLGEGVLNGLLTTRMGLSAIDLIRPLPHRTLPRPTARVLLAEITGAKRQGAMEG